MVAAALLVAAVALVFLQRSSLEQNAQDIAEARAAQVASQVAASGPPKTLAGEGDPDEVADPNERDDDREPESVVIQVQRAGKVVVSSQRDISLPAESGSTTLTGGEDPYVIATSDATWQGQNFEAVVAVSLEDAEESTGALIPLLVMGIPLLLIVVGGVVWLVVGRALRPIERMRAEVATISDQRLEQRVPLPGSRDEVQRLGVTMNEMLQRLQESRDRQRRFVSDASHELRSPITVLRQTGEVAGAHPEAIPPGELVEVMTSESLRLQRLVDQLLLLTRTDERGRQSTEEVDLDDVVFAEAARIRAALPNLRVDTSGVSAARVRGDYSALSQVLRNLTDNAMRHARHEIRFTVAATGTSVTCTVSDDGVGVPAESRERVFERFVRLDEARARDDGGSGLGLAIVAEIAESHGGRARVVEASGGGAQFEVELPFEPDAGVS